jgi:hypothetical protein
MTVRIFVGENQELEELAEEYPDEAAIIEEMLKAAEAEDEADEDKQGRTES